MENCNTSMFRSKTNIHATYVHIGRSHPAAASQRRDGIFITCTYVAFMLHFQAECICVAFPIICILHLCCILIFWGKQDKPIGLDILNLIASRSPPGQDFEQVETVQLIKNTTQAIKNRGCEKQRIERYLEPTLTTVESILDHFCTFGMTFEALLSTFFE